MLKTFTDLGFGSVAGALPGRVLGSFFGLALAAMTLGACASSDVSAIDRASDADIGRIKVTDVTVAVETAKPNPHLEASLRDELKKTLPTCAKGDTAHSVDVTVTDFEDQNVAKAIFIGDEIELKGRVRLTNAETGEKTGEYYVARSFFWGGFIGAAMMSDAEESLSEEFADTVCEEVFGVDVDRKAKS